MNLSCLYENVDPEHLQDFLNENTTNEVLREVTNPRKPSPTNQFLNRSAAEASQNMKNSSNRAQNNNKITILSDVKLHWTNTSFIGNEMKKTDNTNFQFDFQKFVSGKVAVKDQEKEQNNPDDITESDSARKVLKKDRKAKKKSETGGDGDSGDQGNNGGCKVEELNKDEVAAISAHAEHLSAHLAIRLAAAEAVSGSIAGSLQAQLSRDTVGSATEVVSYSDALKLRKGAAPVAILKP
ncbi:unnamed protein product [Arctia plantaginis]|uniref:Uncharacterized protein n=1 Tax=Arctia plantaginis TaxID=874455 RepID=A0A8S1AII8_ARCPL|nr:unnamed protein product [Arctia plantaginis]